MPRTPTVPNIVLVLMDNLGWGELGVYGGGVIRGAAIPRLDKLASGGFQSHQYRSHFAHQVIGAVPIRRAVVAMVPRRSSANQ